MGGKISDEEVKKHRELTQRVKEEDIDYMGVWTIGLMPVRKAGFFFMYFSDKPKSKEGPIRGFMLESDKPGHRLIKAVFSGEINPRGISFVKQYCREPKGMIQGPISYNGKCLTLESGVFYEGTWNRGNNFSENSEGGFTLAAPENTRHWDNPLSGKLLSGEITKIGNLIMEEVNSQPYFQDLVPSEVYLP